MRNAFKAGGRRRERDYGHYKSLENAIFQVTISADFPERVSGYRVTYDYSKSADSTIKSSSPCR